MPETVPPMFWMSVTETVPLGFDFSNLLTGSQTPTNPSSSLVDSDGETVTLPDAPAIDADDHHVIVQSVRGSSLSQKTSYKLTVTATLDTGNVQSMELVLKTN